MNTLAPKPVFDDAKTEAFAERLIRALGEAALALMTSIGHRTGLFDTLGQFDLVTAFDAVHDQKDPQGLLTMVRNSLRPDGVFLMQDIGGSRHLENNIGNPFAPLLYTISLMHCTPISIGQGGPGLGTLWGVETAEEFLAAAGFSEVQTHRLPHDPVNAYFVAQA